MKKIFFYTMCLIVIITLAGCETLKGASRDAGNTARNVRDILRVGKDIRDISK